jgi:hypothetical protein
VGRVWARRLAVGVAIVVGLTVVAAAQAIPLGVYGNTDRFDRLTGQQTDSGETYLAWDQGRTWGSPYSYFLGSLRERPHITLKTAKGGGITPQGIARGKGDAHLIGLALAIAEAAKPVYIRPLAEMNNERNPYCAFYANGRPKGGGKTAAWYRKAFQRIYILMHGGTAKAMSARLRALGMPGVKTDVPVNRHPNLTVIWNPLAVGVPDVRGNHFRDYFPGLKYFDAYGNNYYDTSGVYAFHRTEELYKAYRAKPFMFPEWGLTIDDPSFIKAFAGFVRTHRRVRFISFFNGPAGGRYDLGTKPKSRAAYRRFIVPLSG